MNRFYIPAAFKLAAMAIVPFALTNVASASCLSNNPVPGCVRFNMLTYSTFNPYTTNTNAQQQQWLQQHFWRLRTSTPWWDSNLSWFPNADIYEDAYGVTPGNIMVQQHPDWIMHDINGLPLWINWGCDGTSCTRYAGDFSNPNFRSYWISQFINDMQAGYLGVWLDDVNMNITASDASGNIIPPVDPATGDAMTAQAWEGYMVTFLQEIRSSMPQYEIFQNSVWFEGTRPAGFDPHVEAQILSADTVNLERGFSDPGLTGGTGDWSVNAFMLYIDQVHALGRLVEIQPDSFNGDYDVAGYYLTWAPGDVLSNVAVTPDNWPSNYDLQIGSPLGARYNWNGLIRRDYSNGIALMNVPGNPTVTVTPNGTYKNSSGKSINSVTLAAAQAAVLVGTPYLPPSEVDINCGGGTDGSYEGDEFASNGFTNSTTRNIDLSNVANPAPMGVYQTRRVGQQNGSGFTYTIPNLTPGQSYDVTLHFADIYATDPGQRVFNIYINGYSALHAFDIIKNAGGPFTAFDWSGWYTTPNSANQIVIQFEQGPTTLGPMVNGIKIVPVN